MIIDEYTIDEINMFAAYGWVTETGGRDLIKPPKPKEVLNHNWPDENGTEYDLDGPRYFEEKNTSLTGVILADTIEQFFSFQDAFQLMWAQSGLRRLYKKSYNRSFFVFLKDYTYVGDLTKFKEYGGKIGMRYTILICEPKPGFNRPQPLLIDENGNYFTDGYGNRILMDISAS